MKNEFTIGEISKLHNIPIKTLRYYDSIDLFKPAMVDTRNNYRYYFIEQFEMLNSIKFLRHLGYSINDIKHHLNTEDQDGFITSLKACKKATDNEIRRLKNIKGFLNERITELENAMKNSSLGKVLIKELPKRNIIFLKENIKTIFDLEINLRKLENDSGVNHSIMIGRVGLTISLDNLLNKRFNEYNSIFILNPNGRHTDFSSSLDPGFYACVTFNAGDHKKSGFFYEKIFKHLEKKKLSITGDAIERVIIDDFITKNKEKHLTQIQIPISA